MQQDLKDVVEISSATIGAVAARTRHGSVVCWGEEFSGGDCSTVQQQLVEVEKIYATSVWYICRSQEGSHRGMLGRHRW